VKSEKYLIVLGLGLFALFSYFYSYYFINPVLHHHNQQLAWYKGQLFFEYFQSYPGGLAEYLTLFISQWFVFRGIGSLIIALVGFTLALLMHSIFELRWKKSKIALLLALTVQIITLSLLSDYRFHYSVTVNLVLLAAALLVVARIIPGDFGSKYFG
jgi:hypothetical protein